MSEQNQEIIYVEIMGYKVTSTYFVINGSAYPISDYIGGGDSLGSCMPFIVIFVCFGMVFLTHDFPEIPIPFNTNLFIVIALLSFAWAIWAGMKKSKKRLWFKVNGIKTMIWESYDDGLFESVTRAVHQAHRANLYKEKPWLKKIADEVKLFFPPDTP